AESNLENHYVFHLRFRPPYRWKEILAFLALRATPGVEVVENGVYRRSIWLNGNAGWFEVSPDEQNHSLIIRVQFPDPRCLFFMIERIRSMFDLNADWLAIVPVLHADPLLNRRVEAGPGLRAPVCWRACELATAA